MARHGAKVPPKQSWIALANAGVLAAALLLPTRYGRPRDLLFGLVLSPLMLWVGTRYDVPERARKWCAALGDISYPIYAVHFPVIMLGVFLARRAGVHDAVSIPSIIVSLLIVCYWLGSRVDPAMRAALSRRFGRAARTRAAATA
jgi:peptidoglycan/LPS O-acetylase OafA/YrhL